MFEGCSSLESVDLSNFNTSGKNLDYMFYGCSKLTKLDLSSFDISKSSTKYMFAGATNKPLFVLGTYDSVLNYDYESDKRTTTKIDIFENDVKTSSINLYSINPNKNIGYYTKLLSNNDYTISNKNGLLSIDFDVESLSIKIKHRPSTSIGDGEEDNAMGVTPSTSIGDGSDDNMEVVIDFILDNLDELLPDMTLNYGDYDKMDSLYNVLEKEREEGKIIDISVETKLDILRPGVYNVKYTIIDCNNIKVTHTIKVTVGNKPDFALDNLDELLPDVTFGYGDYNYWDSLNNVLENEIEEGKIYYVNISFDNINPYVPGEYYVVYNIVDCYENEVEKLVKVTIESSIFGDDNGDIMPPPSIPDIPGGDQEPENPGFILDNLDDLLTDITLSYADSLESLYDVLINEKNEGKISEVKVLNANIDTTVPGIYEVTYIVTDCYGNVVIKVITVTVVGEDFAPENPKPDTPQIPETPENPDFILDNLDKLLPDIELVYGANTESLYDVLKDEIKEGKIKTVSADLGLLDTSK
jgi:surface protein